MKISLYSFFFNFFNFFFLGGGGYDAKKSIVTKIEPQKA